MKVNKAQAVREYMEKHPIATVSQIAKACKVKPQYVYQVRADVKKRQAEKKVTLNASQVVLAKRLGIPIEGYAEALAKNKPMPKETDNVNHPAHYKAGGIETIDFIEAKGLGYHLGNVIKYVTRAKHKGNELEDLKKAQWYLNREISKLTGDKA